MRRRFIVLLCLVVALVSACSPKSHVVAPVPAPVGAYSPEAAVRVVEQAWKNRDDGGLACVLTEDFRFWFAAGDSAGNVYSGSPWQRVDELAASKNCFAHASAVEVDFDRVLIPLPDPRPGRHPSWHRQVRTKVDLKVTVDRGAGPDVMAVHGFAVFYAVRGDSAALTDEAAALGGRDTTRWWIDRWEDETLPYSAFGANPAQGWSWGAIKSLFR